MRLGNYNISWSGIRALDKSKTDQDQLIRRITEVQLSRSAQDITKWRAAIAAAEQTARPTRIELVRIFKDVVLDAHLTSVMETRKNKVLSWGFKMVDAAGKENEEASRLFKTAWAQEFISQALDSIFYGYSLIEFGPIIEDEYSSITQVPRQYVIPEKQVFTLTLSGQEIPFNVPPISDWSIFIGAKSDLGLLNKATPLILWKRLVQSVWAEYNELYGVPLRIGKTASRDEDVRGNMEAMLRDMGSSAWALFDEDDQIEIISGIKVGGQATYRDFIKLADEQISKLFVGQTMTNDQGSSRSQAEVHERTLASFTGRDLKLIEYSINAKLLPQMIRHGFNLSGLTYQWDLDEKLNIAAQFDIDKELLKFYDLPTDYIEKTYGTPVEKTKPSATSVMPGVENLYKGFL